MKIGILGGGQLGRMMFQETIGLDLDVSFLDQNREFPVGKIANHFVEGDFTNYEDVMRFGADKDVISIEIEKVNIQALHDLQEQGKIVHPRPAALSIIQNKGLQKAFYEEHHMATSPFQLFEDKTAVLSALQDGKISIPFVQKSRKDGYDGKGVHVVRTEEDLKGLMDVACLVEPCVDIVKELAVIACRNASGEVRTYDVVEMVFDQEANLVKYLKAPAEIDAKHADICKKMATALIEQFDICGLLAVEFFLNTDQEILINEVAPRPHNSGHHTINSAICSQFENHIRAIANLPLGSTIPYRKAAMINILGEPNHSGKRKYLGLKEVLALEDVHIHMYGKSITKPKRKMGHINVMGDTFEEIEEKIAIIEDHFKIIS